MKQTKKYSIKSQRQNWQGHQKKVYCHQTHTKINNKCSTHSLRNQQSALTEIYHNKKEWASQTPYTAQIKTTLSESDSKPTIRIKWQLQTLKRNLDQARPQAKIDGWFRRLENGTILCGPLAMEERWISNPMRATWCLPLYRMPSAQAWPKYALVISFKPHRAEAVSPFHLKNPRKGRAEDTILN